VRTNFGRQLGIKVGGARFSFKLTGGGLRAGGGSLAFLRSAVRTHGLAFIVPLANLGHHDAVLAGWGDVELIGHSGDGQLFGRRGNGPEMFGPAGDDIDAPSRRRGGLQVAVSHFET